MQIDFTVTNVTKFFSTCVLFLIAAHIGMLLMQYGLGQGNLKGLGPFLFFFFDFWSENNLPTFYSSISLLFCGLLLYLISLNERQSAGEFVLFWLGLAVMFTFLSVDEMLMIHDRVTNKVRALMNPSGIFYFAWVIPYGIAVIVLGVIYLRFILSLTPYTRTLFIIAAACYVGGALGFEMIGAVEYEKVQERTLLMDVYNFIEETLEMTGVLVFIRALTNELARRQVQIRLLALNSATNIAPKAAAQLISIADLYPNNAIKAAHTALVSENRLVN